MVLLVWGLGFTVSYFHVSGSADGACTDGLQACENFQGVEVQCLFF